MSSVSFRTVTSDHPPAKCNASQDRLGTSSPGWDNEARRRPSASVDALTDAGARLPSARKSVLHKACTNARETDSGSDRLALRTSVNPRWSAPEDGDGNREDGHSKSDGSGASEGFPLTDCELDGAGGVSAGARSSPDAHPATRTEPQAAQAMTGRMFTSSPPRCDGGSTPCAASRDSRTGSLSSPSCPVPVRARTVGLRRTRPHGRGHPAGP